MNQFHITFSAVFGLALFISSLTCSFAKSPQPKQAERSLSAAYQKARYEIRQDGDFQVAWANNPKQRISTSFDQEGFTVSLQISAETRLKSHWRLIKLGENNVTAGTLNFSETQNFEIQRDDLGLTEWFHNRPNGLEHGYTIEKRPHSDDEDLTLTVSISGDMSIRSDPLGQNIGLFHKTEKNHLLNYSKLKVWDAQGNVLPSYMESNVIGDELKFIISEKNALYPITIDPTFTISQDAYLKASLPNNSDAFGASVAISGNTAVVGAPGESSSANIINGDESDNSASNSGAAYVFTRTGDVWTQEAYLKASNAEAGDSFGISVAISGDTIVIGADGESSSALGINGDESDNSALLSGAAYVFVRENSVWSQEAYLKASNTEEDDAFGNAVAISGNTIVVAANQESSSSVGVNADELNNAASGSGAAYVFDRIGTTWSQQAYLKASNTEEFDNFGTSVALSGGTLVIGADSESSSATGVDGDQTDNLTFSSGAAYVFARNSNSWSQEAYLKASNTDTFDSFGASVSISGDTLVVGASEESSSAVGVGGDESNNSLSSSGAVYVFSRNGSIWAQEAYLKASNAGLEDAYGVSVSISGNLLAVGADQESSSSIGINGDELDDSLNSGAVYLYERTASSWVQNSYIKASNTGESDLFGGTLALSGNTLLVAASGEDSSASGINGNETDNTASNSGAAYIFSADTILADSPPFDVERISILADNDATIEFESQAGRSYQIQYSNDLVTWLDIAQIIVADGDLTSWRDSGAPATSSAPGVNRERFYRVLDVTN